MLLTDVSRRKTSMDQCPDSKKTTDNTIYQFKISVKWNAEALNEGSDITRDRVHLENRKQLESHPSIVGAAV